jgi:predicted alpha/beta hydrolase family esterase
MKNALLIHGWNTKSEYYDASRPTASNDHWFPWLTKQLVLNDINTVSIEMPNGYYPEYDVWKRELERYDITPETILVGHSCGGGFLVRWLSETNIKVGKVVLVAPWLGYNTEDEPFDKSFFDFVINGDIASKTQQLHVFYSDDDFDSIQRSVSDIKTATNGVNFRGFHNKGHFTMKSLGGPEFPELLEEIVR